MPPQFAAAFIGATRIATLGTVGGVPDRTGLRKCVGANGCRDADRAAERMSAWPLVQAHVSRKLPAVTQL